MAKPKLKRRDPNHVLAWLPAADYARLASKLETVTLRRGQPIHEPDKPIAHVYFPRSGVASVVSRMTEGGVVEVATIGNEGIVGLTAYLGDGRSPMEVFVQIPGEAARMDANTFRQELRSIRALSEAVRRYAQALLMQIGQSAVCNRIHSMDQRCARWLLMSHDRVLGNEIALTQEFLGEMLGVRRASVTRAAGILRHRGLIAYRRGKIQILDRKGLEKAACECYGLIRLEHDRMLG